MRACCTAAIPSVPAGQSFVVLQLDATAGAQRPSGAMQRVNKIRMWNESGTVGWPLHASELATFLQSTSASC
jgi:hypothetical protein